VLAPIKSSLQDGRSEIDRELRDLTGTRERSGKLGLAFFFE